MAVKLRKAKPEKGKLKVCLYGSYGSGKSLTALLLAEWLAKKEKKRIAYIDTEHSTDFYAAAVPERTVHPEAFDFDRDVTRSILDVRDFLQTVDTDVYGVVVLDSITHLWDSAKEIYSGKMTRVGSFPIQAWQVIKRPWKQMMEAGVNGQFHFIICGRLGNVFEENEEGKMESRGTRVKAEGEAAYEPDLTCRLYQFRETEKESFTIKMFVEKDRSGALMGKTITWPLGESFEPVYKYLVGEHGGLERSEDMVSRDVAKLETEDEEKKQDSIATYEMIRRAILESADEPTLKSAWELAKGKKTKLGDDNWESLSTLKDTRKQEIRQRSVA